MSRNPWLDASPVDRCNEIKKELEIAARAGRKAADGMKDIKVEALKFEADVLRLQKHLQQKPDDWRRVRALIVVDIPSILQAIDGLGTISDPDARAPLLAATKSAMTAVGPAVKALEAARAEDLRIGLEVAAQGALAAPREDDAPSGFLGGLGRRARKATEGATGLLSSAQQSVTGFGSDLTGRATAVLAGALELSGEYIGEAGRAVTRPVTLRATALIDAATGVGITALILGGITTLIFPPLAPFVVGETLLAMPSDYQRHLATLSAEDAREELRRSGEREDRIADIMQSIRGGLVRFDTDHLSITIDPARGTETGIVLSGRFTGEMLEAISAADVDLMLRHAPDDETRRALDAWKRRRSA